jgi:hypothetical protein
MYCFMLNGGFDQTARDKLTKDRLTKDKVTKDRLPKDQVTKGGRDKLTKDRLTKDAVKDKSGRDKLTKERSFTKDNKTVKDKDRAKLKNDAKDKTAVKDKRGGKDKAIAKDAKDKGGKDRVGKDRTAIDKGGKGKTGKDRSVTDKAGKGGKGKAGKAQSARSKTVPERRPVQRISKAKSPVERSKIRVDHRRQMQAARSRLPPRPFPGTAGFTGVPPAGETRFRSTEMVFHAGANVSRQSIEAAAKRHGMVIVAAQTSSITGGTVYICQVPSGVAVARAVGAMEAEGIGVASPNYVYVITQDTASDTQSAAGSPDQYTVDKLHLAEVHKIATGRDVRVAVVDS